MPSSPCLAVGLAALLSCMAAAVAGAAATPGYTLVSHWPQALPKNTNRFTAVCVVQDTVYVAQRDAAYPQPLLMFDRSTGQLLGSEGSKIIFNGQSSGWGVHGMNAVANASAASNATLWITDVENFTVTLATTKAEPLVVLGTPGHKGTSVQPLRFGNVADVDFDPAARHAFISDGDGGVNSRVLALNYSQMPPTLLWAVGSNGSAVGQYNSPHTLTFHPPTQTVLVGDRGNSRIVQLRASDGKVLDLWSMAPLAPWGLRYVAEHSAIVMADGTNQVGWVCHEGRS